MAGPTAKKRRQNDLASRPKRQKPNKRPKKQLAYNSDSDDGESNPEFKPVNLLDSDNEDLDNVVVDDGGFSSEEDSDSGSDSAPEYQDENLSSRQKERPREEKSATKPKAKAVKYAQDAPADEEAKDDEDEDDDGEDSEGSAGDEDESGSEADEDGGASRRPKSKRNDPSAFATSMSKILNTKLSTSRREDPLLSRSAEAQKASRAQLDGALEAKARRQMRHQKQLALEKGRVRDVLLASGRDGDDDDGGFTEGARTTAELLEAERRLRKVAQRGVVKLFNAVRTAQVRGQEAEREARREGFVGVKGREEKVNEMSRKGFLDLIASGGGGLKKGGLEEA